MCGLLFKFTFEKNFMIKYILLLFALNLISLFSQKVEWVKILDLHGTDGGYNFVGISSFDSLNAVALVDVEHEKNTGDAPFRQILKTTDGGLTWNSIYYDSVHTFNKAKNIYYYNINNIVATCQYNSVLKTSDGGKTWNEIFFPEIPYYLGMLYIDMYDSLHIAVSSLSNIAYTDDGYKTHKWIKRPVNSDISYGFAGLKFISANTIYFLTGPPPGLSKYDIKNDSWSIDTLCFPSYDPLYQTPANMYFQDSLNGIVVGDRYANIANTSYDMIHKTTDGGKTWVEVLNEYRPRKFGLQYVDFCDRDNGIATGMGGKVYWTHDGGSSWVQDSSGVIFNADPTILHVAYLSKYTALIADFEGRIFRSSLPTGVQEEDKVNETEIYPNPVTDFLHINIEEELNKPISIYSIYGIKVLETNSKVIDVRALPAGVYMLRSGSKFMKFVKM